MSTTEPKTQRITIAIPEDSTAEEGDFLEFFINGQDLSIPVPPGAKPGDTFDIIISEANQAEDQDMEEAGGEGLSVTIDLDLADKSKVTMTLDTTPIPRENCQDVNDGDHTHSVAWPSGIFLAKFLASGSVSSLIKNKSVLELGSGLGVVGLACAVAGASKVAFTDVPGALPVLKRSVEETKTGILQKLNPNVKLAVHPLVWGATTGAIGRISDYDVVIGSDLIYNPNCEGGYESLATTLAEASVIIMAVRWRKPDLERKFFEIMEEKHGYHFEVISIVGYSQQSKTDTQNPYLPCSLNWKQYGDPKCEAFQKYFQSMMITVAGTETVSLSQLTDEQVEKFTDEEFQMYEATQTQIYKGIKSLK